MVILLGLVVVLILVVAFIHAEIRSAWCEIRLSNGVDVLVSPELCREIMQRFEMSDEPDVSQRWNQAVLAALHAERPQERSFLIRELELRQGTQRRPQYPVNA
jgi:hypothetical protein